MIFCIGLLTVVSWLCFLCSLDLRTLRDHCRAGRATLRSMNADSRQQQPKKDTVPFWVTVALPLRPQSDLKTHIATEMTVTNNYKNG